MTKGCIYYTDNRPRWFILEKCQEEIKKGWKGKLVSVSLKPINFGENIVLKGRSRSYPTMLQQIIMGLEALDTDVVFFLEHDVLYHPSHFDFWPEKEEVYYYNVNNFRWSVKETYAVSFDGLHSLSELCCFRKTALEHFKKRLKYVEDQGWDKNRAREPRCGNIIGYEPGTKPVSRGGFSDEPFEIWRSKFPNIDIRHRHCFSSPQYPVSEKDNPPASWKKENIKDIPYWNLKELYDTWWEKYPVQLTKW